MDNCSRQNKNRMVLRLAPLLVEMGLYRRVNFIFLVIGHTKNCADRLFNLLKLDYRWQNVYTVEDLMDVLGKSNYVTPIRVNVPGDILDFNNFESRIYMRLRPGTIKRNQVFYSEMQRLGVLWIKETAVAETGETQLLGIPDKDGSDQQTLINNLTDYIQVVPAPGLTPIKLVEMWKKWRKYVPETKRTQIYDYPGDAIMAKVASDRRQKDQQKKAAKKQKTTSDAAAAGDPDAAATQETPDTLEMLPI